MPKSAPRECSMNLSPDVDYGGISQCKFDIKAFSDAPMLMDKRTSEAPLLMAPTTPNKKSKTEAYDATVSEDNQAGTTSPAKINETKTAQGKLLFKAKKNDLTIEVLSDNLPRHCKTFPLQNI